MKLTVIALALVACSCSGMSGDPEAIGRQDDAVAKAVELALALRNIYVIPAK
jgi:hypothetical protein